MARGADRPYFQRSISELETVFDEARSDAGALRVLARELTFRTTERAAKLRTKVADALAVLSASDGVETAPPPLIATIGELPSCPVPATANEPTAILAAWTALEALSPQTYRRPEDLAAGDRRCVAALSGRGVPWAAGERSRPKKQLYYHVLLGSILMARATDDLVAAFGEDEERSSRIREKAIIAAVLVNRHGIPVDENGIAVSSYAWALPLALQRRLDALGTWHQIEPEIVQGLDRILRRVDDEGMSIPLDLPTIERAHRWLVAQLRLPAHLVEPPTFVLRVYHYFKAKSPPEALLLNSFFLGDLARSATLIDRNAAPVALRRYLGLEKPTESFDLLTDERALEKAVAPAMMPCSRWPSCGGHPLVLLQQAAVNLARSQLSDGEGIIAVNGPPGTGKTTLLRDVVAGCVLDRALAMAMFDDPENAFIASGERVPAGDKAFFHLYTLDRRLKGHEILVASSNNRAVENISKELPAVTAIGRTTDDLRYFKSVSDAVYGHRERSSVDGEEDDVAPDHLETWGLIAAVLGNARNCAAFQESFWWHDDRGFRLYLKAVKGDTVVREIKDPTSGRIERSTPSIVLVENPPSPQEAKANWRRARERLLSLKRDVEADLDALERARQQCLQVAEARRTFTKREATLKTLAAQKPSLEAKRSSCQCDVEIATREHELRSAEVGRHRPDRPAFWARLFRTRTWQSWQAAHMPLVAAELNAARQRRHAEQALSEATKALNALTANVTAVESDKESLRQRIPQLSETVDAHRRALGDRLVDDLFYARGHAASNLAAPWIPDGLHRKREDLFIAALAVHRAFIDAVPRQVLHNLSVLMGILSSGPPQDETRRRFLGELWSTLFLVVPVVSTTFASVERMLGGLPAGSIGWLLIDEAGQALPQAAAGAIMRAKRCMVVGDPLQIPPVVTLPERLISEICKFFKVEKAAWAAPEASTQTLADQASTFQAVFRSDQGPRRVGIPLLVHRRCQEPMFGISNRMAYEGQMVWASGTPRPGRIGAALGPSKWFDVDGDADSKWCPAEGELIVNLLGRMALAEIADPDLFIIMPFRIVAQALTRRLEREAKLFADLGVDARQWVSHRVGTIHTVQGREADAVILLLGAPNASQHGARSWAAATPNILNVAVSRARQCLYVVGSHGAWSGVGHARELASSLPVIRV